MAYGNVFKGRTRFLSKVSYAELPSPDDAQQIMSEFYDGHVVFKTGAGDELKLMKSQTNGSVQQRAAPNLIDLFVHVDNNAHKPTFLADGASQQDLLQFLTCSKMKSTGTTSGANGPSQEMLQDVEFRDLMVKYGDRLRMPPLPSGEPIPRTRSTSPRKQPVPRTPRPKRPDGHGPSAAVPLSPPTAAVATPAASTSDAARLRNGGNATMLPPIRRASAASHPDDEDEEESVPEPARSLMPRKDLLRKKQRNILKNANVGFYKQPMKARFKEILQAVELTFVEATALKAQRSPRTNF